MPLNIQPRWDPLLLTLTGAILFLPFLGGVHLFDWDEINFAECAREMMLTGDYLRVQIDYLPFYEKPPLFIWMQVISMNIWGIGEYGARFPNALAGMITLIVIWRLGNRIGSRQTAWWWVLCYTGSLLPHFYFKSGIIDPVFNLFIFLSIWQLSRSTSVNALYAGIFTGLAILTKGPVALLLVALTWGVVWLQDVFQERKAGWKAILSGIPIYQILIYLTSSLAVAGSWFAVDYLQNGPEFLQKFIQYQIRLFSTHDAGHKGFPGYHFVVLLLGCFPASIFAIQQLFKKSGQERHFIWIKSLFWVVLILFSLVQSKIVHYSSACYLPLTMLAAVQISALVRQQRTLTKMLQGLLAGIGICLSGLLIALPFAGNHIDVLKPLFSKDPFAMGNLEAAPDWPYHICLAGVFLLAVLLIGHYYNQKKQFLKSNTILLAGTTLFIAWIILLLPPRIEAYSQRAAIEFYQEQANSDVFVAVYGFKSYAHLWYSQKKPGSPDNKSLLYEEINKPVNIVCKVQHTERLKQEIPCREIGRKNGFVFFEKVTDNRGQY